MDISFFGGWGLGVEGRSTNTLLAGNSLVPQFSWEKLKLLTLVSKILFSLVPDSLSSFIIYVDSNINCMLSRSVSSDTVIAWTAAQQAPLSMGFSRQEYWSGLSCSLPGDLPNAGIKPGSSVSPELQADSLPAE